MDNRKHLSLIEIETEVCDLASEQLGIPRDQVGPASRLVRDLHCDSIDFFELIMESEDHFHVTIPYFSDDPFWKTIFTRPEFRLSDLAEIICLRQGTGRPARIDWRGKRPAIQVQTDVPFCQLGGRWNDDRNYPFFELYSDRVETKQFRRRSDGMRCVLVPAATVEIGTDDSAFDRDSGPRHDVPVDSFLIDAEPVSTTAYCRFLNSITDVKSNYLFDWFLLAETDDRSEHVLIEQTDAGWQPIVGCERWPIMLVSWYGANAYSLWANRQDWHQYQVSNVCFLPSEAQWEYAARGSKFRMYPWGDAPPNDRLMRFGQHFRKQTYSANTLPIAAVNEEAGMSPFGLHHMAGNVWQWCRDWYDKEYYSRPEATEKNTINQQESGVRSERGGSWVGPAELCRSSHRRGRAPDAKGRCLGFRCVSDPADLK